MEGDARREGRRGGEWIPISLKGIGCYLQIRTANDCEFVTLGVLQMLVPPVFPWAQFWPRKIMEYEWDQKDRY